MDTNLSDFGVPDFHSPDSLSSCLTFGALQGGRATAIPAAGQELVELSNGSCWTVLDGDEMLIGHQMSSDVFRSFQDFRSFQSTTSTRF